MRSSSGSEGAKDQKNEGRQLCIDIIQEIREITGVAGVHVMAYRQEEYVAEIIDESGVLDGPRAAGIPAARSATANPEQDEPS